MLWLELYSAELASSYSISKRSRRVHFDRDADENKSSGFRPLPRIPGQQSSYPQNNDGSDDVSDEDDEQDTSGRGQNYNEDNLGTTGSRPQTTREGSIRVPSVLSSFVKFGPLIPRILICSDGFSEPCPMRRPALTLASPQVSISLQRTAFGSDTSRGSLTIGGPPPEAADGDRGELTWAPVRLYTPDESGAALLEAPGEIYPYAWEAMMGDVWFDGVKLDRSRLCSRDVEVSALVDTVRTYISSELFSPEHL